MEGSDAGDVGEPVGILEGDHPAGVLEWKGADVVELLDLLGGEDEVGGGEVVFELLGLFRADDNGGDEGFGEDPGEGDGGNRSVVGLSDGFEHVEDAPGAVLVDEGEVEGGAAGVFGFLVVAGELAGEEAASEGTPDEEAGALVFEHGDDLALEVTAGNGVVGLEGVEFGEVFGVGDAEGLHDLPGHPVGAADVADLALGDEGVEGVKGLFDGGDGVGAVDLVEVDVVGREALEGGVDGVHKVPAGGSDIVATGAGAAESFGGDDDVLAGEADVPEGRGEGLFGFAIGVDIGSVDEVDAGVEGGLEEGVGTGLIDAGDGLPDAFAGGKGHGAEADL